MKKQMKMVLAYKNPKVVKKYASEENLDIEEAKKHFEECKKFLYACSISDKQLSPSKKLDKIWHQFILFTEDYANFCKEYLGCFIHHVPDTVMSVESQKKNREAFEYAKTLTETLFGEIDESVWQSKKGLVIAGDCEAKCGGCHTCSNECHGCKSE